MWQLFLKYLLEDFKLLGSIFLLGLSLLIHLLQASTCFILNLITTTANFLFGFFYCSLTVFFLSKLLGHSATCCSALEQSVGSPASQRGHGLQFPSDQALWDKQHPQLPCEAAVRVNNDLETCGHWAGCCMRCANCKNPNSGE